MAGSLEPVEHHENPVLTANGEEWLIVCHNVLLRDQQGRPTGALRGARGGDGRSRCASVFDGFGIGFCFLVLSWCWFAVRALGMVCARGWGGVVGVVFCLRVLLSPGLVVHAGLGPGFRFWFASSGSGWCELVA